MFQFFWVKYGKRWKVLLQVSLESFLSVVVFFIHTLHNICFNSFGQNTVNAGKFSAAVREHQVSLETGLRLMQLILNEPI